MSNQLHEPRWTHVALPCGDIDRAVEFYTTLTPLVVVDRLRVDGGESVWLANAPHQRTPFALVLLGSDENRGQSQGVLQPFAHIGIEVPQRGDVDAWAQKAEVAGCLHWEPRQMPDPIGYICGLKDPDGNIIEIAHGQRVYDTIQKTWEEQK